MKVNDSQPWTTMVQCCIVTMIVSICKSTMVNQGPMPHSDKYCLNMEINHCINRTPTLHYDKESNMVNNGSMLHCDNDSFDLKINHDQPFSNMVNHGQIFKKKNKKIFILGFITLCHIFIASIYYSPGFIISIPRVY